MSYIDIYNIQETKTMLRGTFRNTGWCETLDKIADLGLLDIEERSFDGITYADLMKELSSAGNNDLKEAVANFCKVDKDSKVISRFEWLGLFDERKIDSKVNTRLDALCALFEEKMNYAPGERDMIVMHHEFIAEYPDKKQKITSTMIDYGIPDGDSSMSRTVALPVAIASRMILEGRINLTGVYRPIIPEIYEPILEELATLNISLEEHTHNL
jgi:saccharopine dehydrogenase-like NADP-dependent oxidoreductase